MDVLTPLAWLGLGMLALFSLYLAVRFGARAWFKSKLEYHKELKKSKEEKLS